MRIQSTTSKVGYEGRVDNVIKTQYIRLLSTKTFYLYIPGEQLMKVQDTSHITILRGVTLLLTLL